jgi:hypothetical protein
MIEIFINCPQSLQSEWRCEKKFQDGDATGSSDCNGSGTIPAQTTIWFAVLINQVSREKGELDTGLKQTKIAANALDGNRTSPSS